MASKHKKLRIVLLTIALLICVLAITVFILLNSQFVVRETAWKYHRAPKDYPSLNYITVPQLKAILQQDTTRFKVLTFTDCPGYDDWDEIISKPIADKWHYLDHDKVSLYVIISDCGGLECAEDYFSKFDSDCHKFVIRDNSKPFRSYGSFFPDLTRLARILRFIAPSENMCMIDCQTNMLNSVLLDRHNNVKLARLECTSYIDIQKVIVPMPFEIIDSLESTDFNIIEHIHVGNQAPGMLFFYFYPD